MDKVYQEYGFNLRFGGENEISAKLFCEIINNIIIATNEVKDSEIEKTDFKIISTDKGSFVAYLKIGALVLSSLLTEPDNINYASNILKCITEFLKLKIFIKGEKPKSIKKEGGKINVENNEGETRLFNLDSEKIDLFNNATFNNCILQMANSLQQNEVPSFKVTDQNGVAQADIKINEYKYIATPVFSEEENEQVFTTEVECNLWVRVANFSSGGKWEFMYNKTIHAKVEDDAWISKVRDGEILINSKGYLNAIMRIEQNLDKYGVPIEGAVKYYVVKVKNYIIPNTGVQTTMQSI